MSESQYEKNIKLELESAKIDVKFDYYDATDSTNTIAKNIINTNPQHGQLIVAKTQTSGRGTYGRTFISNDGGIYMTIILDTNTWKFKSPHLATHLAAVVTGKSITEVLGIKLDLKWVNDLFLDGKKIGGILTEKAYNSNWMVIGIGLNIANNIDDFPKKIKNLVTTANIHDSDGKIKAKIIATILKNLLNPDKLTNPERMLDDYKNGLFIMNREVLILQNAAEFLVKVIDVTEAGELVVLRDDQPLVLKYGEVKLKL